MMRADGRGGPLLRVDGVSVHGRGAWPLRGVSLDVAAGEAFGVLGPRGSGKTLLLDVISGFLRPAQGHVVFLGEDLTRWPAHRIARAGIARTFQTAPVLDGAPVREAVRAAAVGRGLGARQIHEAIEQALALTGLEAVQYRPGTSLPPAEQRLLRLAMVAAAAPRLALLDEPLAGLAPAAAGRIVSVLRRLHGRGAALLVTAHDPASLRVVCSRAVLLRGGRIAGSGRPAEMDRD
jgi:ABC-type branched-subunit amino acid transport system ATPase component